MKSKPEVVESRSRQNLAVSVEAGEKRVFATAIDWPGWSRSGKTEELALEALARYAPRYRPIAQAAAQTLPPGGTDLVEVVERVTGGSGTDFGVPYAITYLDRRPVSAEAAEREVAIVEAAWAYLDQVVAGAPAELRKGPRGGGRDRDKVDTHCREADEAYARELGIRPSDVASPGEDKRPAVRAAVSEILRRASDGSSIAGKKWPARYAARRIAWHTLDHAWEIEDRSE